MKSSLAKFCFSFKRIMKILDSDRKIYLSMYVNICKGSKSVECERGNKTNLSIQQKADKEKQNLASELFIEQFTFRILDLYIF